MTWLTTSSARGTGSPAASMVDMEEANWPEALMLWSCRKGARLRAKAAMAVFPVSVRLKSR